MEQWNKHQAGDWLLDHLMGRRRNLPILGGHLLLRGRGSPEPKPPQAVPEAHERSRNHLARTGLCLLARHRGDAAALDPNHRKVRLALTPWMDQSWAGSVLRDRSGELLIGNEIFEVEFDFINHRLVARKSRQGGEGMISAGAHSQSRVHHWVIGLSEPGLALSLPSATCQANSQTRSASPKTACTPPTSAAHRFWRVLVQAIVFSNSSARLLLGK